MQTDSSIRKPAVRRRIAFAVALAALAGGAVLAIALAPRADAGGIGPDVTVFSLPNISNWGSVGGTYAYSLGTTSCNQGDQPLNWCNNGGGCGMGTTDEDHPVIAQNLYRLKDGRFEQIGMSWLKHGFTSLNLSSSGCGNGSCANPPLGGNQLGVGCTDPYDSSLNGNRGHLGMRSEVDAATGEFPYPFTEPGWSTAIDQRIQVAGSDLDPDLNPGARYWMEGQYVAPDDAINGNALNNASYREVFVSPGSFNLGFQSGNGTVQELPAIAAWPVADPDVELVPADVPSTPVERFHVARKVTDLGGGSFHYEYAIHNLNSDRSARSFTIDFPGAPTISNAGFRDVDHHSGEPYSTTDWTIDTSTPGQVTWSTETFGINPNANALRWGTMFSFWFDATAGPGGTDHTIGLFKPGAPTEIDFSMGGGIFQDGFESGDTSGWSSASQ